MGPNPEFKYGIFLTNTILATVFSYVWGSPKTSRGAVLTKTTCLRATCLGGPYGNISEPRGSRYQIMKDLGPKSHNNYGLQALVPK